ncbi:MAG: hypothetical protein IKN80_03695, partial [Clostridiales bacterium]|nr:hypothetical protein [Clostridiales bacterium]
MITRKSTRRKMGLVSVALVASIIMQWLIIPEIKWDAGVNADGLSFDSSTMINYQTILGGAVDYGVVCGTLNQTSHSETTWACNTFINTNGSYNNDVDYLTSTAHFLMGSLDAGSKVSFGASTASALYIEAPESVFGLAEGDSFAPPLAGRNPGPGNFEFTTDYDIEADQINKFLVLRTMDPAPTPFESPVMQVVNANASKNVNRLINRMAGDVESGDIGWSATLANRAASSSSYCLNPNGYCDYFYSLKGVKLDGTNNTFENCQKLLINLTDPMFAGQVVYINVTSDMIPYFTRGDGVWIFKDDSTNVVFNIADDAYTGESLNLEGQRLIITNSFPVGGPNGDGTQDIQADSLTCTYNFKSGETATNGGVSTPNNYDAVTTQQHYNQSIIWNILESGTVNINNMGGVMLFPNATRITASGNNTGWLVAKNRFDMGAEFHFLYSGKSDDSVGQMHFALRKAFAEGYGHKGDYAEDSSVSFGYGAFDFIWQEYTDETYTTTMGDSQTIPVEATSYVILPKLSFADPTDTDHYIAKPDSGTTSVPFYFRVTESQAKTIENVENSQGRIDIQLTVTVDSSGSYTYKVSYTSISGDNTTVYDSGSNVPMSGVQFDLGAFINKKTTTTPGSIEISKTIVLGNNVSINDIHEITFYVKDGDQIVKTIYLDPKNPGTGWTVSDSGDTYTFIVDDLVVGKEYTVVEDVSGAHDDIVLSPTSDVDNKTVRASAAATLPEGAKAAFTNDYTQQGPTGTLTVNKVIKLDGAVTQRNSGSYYVVLTSDNGTVYYNADGSDAGSAAAAVQPITGSGSVTY